MAESDKADDRDQVSALARSILKHIQVEGGNNIPLAMRLGEAVKRKN